MSLWKKVVLTVLVSLSLVPVYLLVVHGSLTFLSLGNSFFMLSLGFFSLSALISVLRSGFFDYFQHSLRATRRQSHNEKDDTSPKASQLFNQPPFTFLITALILLAVSLTLLFFH